MRKYNLKVGVFDCTTAVQDGRFWCRMQIVWRQGTVSCPGTRSITNIIHIVLSTLKELCQEIYQNFSSWNHHQSNLRETKKYLLKTWKEGSSDKANTKWGTHRPDRLTENWNRWQNYCALITDIMAFVTFRGPSRKNLLNAWAKWQVYATARQFYTPNVECRTRKCIILTWIYSKLPKIQILTKKFPDCKIHGSWLKDAFINEECLHFVTSLLSNIQHCFLSF